MLGEATIGAHAKDFRILEQLMVGFEEAEIGSGLMDHQLYLREMQRVCPDGHVLIEHLPPSRYGVAAAKYKEIAERAGITWDNAPGGVREQA